MAKSTKDRIILAGGTGFLGSLLGKFFEAQGKEVIVLTRHHVLKTEPACGKAQPQQQHLHNGAISSVVLPFGAAAAGPRHNSAPFGTDAGIQYIEWDGASLGSWAEYLNGASALINLAGRSVNCRYNERNRRLIMDSRILSTRVLGEAIAQCGTPPPVWLNASTATIYKHSFLRSMDEARGEIGSTPEAKDAFSVEVACEWEKAFAAASTPSTRKVALRTAMVFGTAKGTVFDVLSKLVRFGLGGKMADGKQFVSWIHESDFCTAVDWLLSHNEISGNVNLASPNPVTNAELMASLRRLYHMPFGLPAPRWALELGAVFLRTETELIIKSRRVVPDRLLSSGFLFRYPVLFDALQNLCAQLNGC